MLLRFYRPRGSLVISWIELAAYLSTGVCAGLIAGLLGVGGGVIVVPALVWLFSTAGFAAEWSFHLAVGTSLATLIGTDSAPSYLHHRRGAVRWDLVRILAPWLVIGAWIGSAGAGLLDATWLRRSFGLFQLYVGLDMLFKRTQSEPAELPSTLRMGLIATEIGSLSALLDIAGGTLTVPFLTRSGLDIRRALPIPFRYRCSSGSSLCWYWWWR